MQAVGVQMDLYHRHLQYLLQAAEMGMQKAHQSGDSNMHRYYKGVRTGIEQCFEAYAVVVSDATYVAKRNADQEAKDKKLEDEDIPLNEGTSIPTPNRVKDIG